MENQHRLIKGYRELDQSEIDMMNKIKEQGERLRELYDEALNAGGDPRWAAIGRTHFQQGLMALTRSIAKPESF